MCKVSDAVNQYLKDNPGASDIEVSTVAVHTAREAGVHIGLLFRSGQSILIEIGGIKQWFSA